MRFVIFDRQPYFDRIILTKYTLVHKLENKDRIKTRRKNVLRRTINDESLIIESMHK